VLRVGDRLGAFRVTAVLGAGGMGAVFAAFDERLERRVAIKVLYIDESETARRRLVREARLAARLDHPGVVRIFELGEHQDQPFVVMELVSGATLADLAIGGGRPPPAALAAAGEAIARAAAAAHAAGVIHRDIKPRNVMLTDSGAIKVLDFGLARPDSGDLAKITASGALNGTPLYLAPELLDGGKPTALSDVWALGVTLAELGTGATPFANASLTQLFTAIATAPPAIAAIEDERVREVVARMLTKLPAGRPGSMSEVAELLAPMAKAAELHRWARNAVESVARLPSRDAGADVSPEAPTETPSRIVALPAPPRVAAVASPGPAPGSLEPTGPMHLPRSDPPPGRPPSSRPAPLEDAALDALADRSASLPEPLAALVGSVLAARADVDATGVRKRLFELGVGVVRYATSIGLAVLVARLGGATAPRPLADALGRAARLSDGAWCDLARRVGAALRSLDAELARCLAFVSHKPLADLIAARNEFIHGGASGNSSLPLATAVLDDAAALCALRLRAVVSARPPTFEARLGVPAHPGMWRRATDTLPGRVRVGAAYVLLGAEAPEWIEVTPWLPLQDGRLLLIDSPHAAGKPWRSSDPETGEHREHADLDEAVRRLAGVDPHRPRELCDRPTLVGRAAALRALTRAAEEASNGAVRVVLLTGAFGIGRSRLAEAVGEAAAGLGFGRVLAAACSADRPTPLRPIRRAIEGAGLGRVEAAIGRVLMTDPLATVAVFEAGIEAVEESLVEASLSDPIALVLDDAQWADEKTLALLRLLTERATRDATGKLLVVTTVRDEPRAPPALLRFIGQVEQDVGSGATRMALPPLDDAEATRVVRGVAPLSAELEQVVVAGAGGAPFFLVQPLLVWGETGALVWESGAWRPGDPGLLASAAPGVRELVRARIASFFDAGSAAERAAQQVLAAVALHGAPLSLDRLVDTVASTGTEALAAEHALEALVEAGLLAVSGDELEHDFAQGVIRRAVLDDLRTRPWFRRVHRSLLEVVAAAGEPDDAAFLASGWEALRDAAQTARWRTLAVERALETGSFDQAVELGEALERSARDAAERGAATLRIVDALLRAGRGAEARERLTTVDSPALPPRAALEARVLAIVIGAHAKELTVDHDARLIADVDALGDARLRVEARIAVAALVRGARGFQLAEEAARLVPAGSDELLYRALSAQVERFVEMPGVDRGERRRVTELARQVARRVGSSWVELETDNHVAALLVDDGDAEAAAAQFREIAARAAEHRFGTLSRSASINVATCLLRAGRAEEAAACAAGAAQACRSAGDIRLLAIASSVRADALLRARQLEPAREAADEAVRLALPARDYTTVLAMLRRAEIHLELGDALAAQRDAQDAEVLAKVAGQIDHTLRAALLASLAATALAAPDAGARLRRSVADAEAVAETELRASTRALLERAKTALRTDPDAQ
jgi:serine/threonine protein kinase/tetratricopeptide (TPR) repeat protein